MELALSLKNRPKIAFLRKSCHFISAHFTHFTNSSLRHVRHDFISNTRHSLANKWHQNLCLIYFASLALRCIASRTPCCKDYAPSAKKHQALDISFLKRSNRAAKDRILEYPPKSPEDKGSASVTAIQHHASRSQH